MLKAQVLDRWQAENTYSYKHSPFKLSRSDFVIACVEHSKCSVLCVVQLLRPCDTDVLRRCKYMLRKQQYHELTTESPIQALTFLQQSLAETVDHNDSNETDEVHRQTLTANAI